MAFERIVVTGGAGFVGSAVVSTLRAAGYEVQSCSRREGVDLREGTEAARFLGEAEPTCVVHCAAHVGGLGYVGAHAIDVFEDNLQIAQGLMQGMRQAGIERLITVMPNCTYPGAADIYREDEWWDGPIHESVLMYGLPRKTLWGLCKTYGNATGLRSAHLIFPNMYGPGDHFEPIRSHALGALIAKVAKAQEQGKTEVEIWGSGRPVREWMYVHDAADAVLRFCQLSERDESVLAGHPIYNVGIAQGVSIAELAEQIRTAFGWEGKFIYDRSRPDGALQKLLDGERFHRLTGWRPATALPDGIAQTIAWYRAHVGRELSYAH